MKRILVAAVVAVLTVATVLTSEAQINPDTVPQHLEEPEEFETPAPVPTAINSGK